MVSEYDILMEKIKSMAQKALTELHDELYPKKLGEAIMVQTPEIRLTILAKYEGVATILQKLGVDISKLETFIEKETDMLMAKHQ